MMNENFWLGALMGVALGFVIIKIIEKGWF